MKAQANFLIKLKDFNIIVSDEKPKSNDVVYINNEIYSNEIRIFTSAFGYDNLKDCVKVLALDNYTKYPYNLPSIDYNGLEEDFGVVDIEKQLSESDLKSFDGSYDNFHCQVEAFKKGFKKAQSLNDKHFSSNVVRRMLIDISRFISTKELKDDWDSNPDSFYQKKKLFH